MPGPRSVPKRSVGPRSLCHDRGNRGPYRSRQDRFGEGADRRRRRSAQGGEGTRHHHRSRLCLQRSGRRTPTRLRRRARSRAVRAQHAGRRHRHRCGTAGRVGGGRHKAPDRGASADPRPAGPRSRHRCPHQGRSRQRRPAARAYGRDRDLARHDLAARRGDRARLVGDGTGHRRAEGKASDPRRERQGRCGLRAPCGGSLLRPVRSGRRRHRHRARRRDQGRRPASADAVRHRGEGAVAACPEPGRGGGTRRRTLCAQSRRTQALQGSDQARRLGGESGTACADGPNRRPAQPARLRSASPEALVAGACSPGLGARHGTRGAARRREAGAGRHGPRADRSGRKGRRACGRQGHPSRSVRDAHDGRGRGDRSVRAAAQPARRAATGGACSPCRER